MQKHEMTKGTLNFLHTEIEAATTFVAIAKQAEYEDKVVRNIANARKACKAMRHFMDLVHLSEDEAAEIERKLAGVENELAALEASVSRKTEPTEPAAG